MVKNLRIDGGGKRRARKAFSRIALSSRNPAVSVEDLALMLEIDLGMGRRDEFVSRLRRALKAAAEGGYSEYG